MAHITGGGIHDNLIRILPGVESRAEIDLTSMKIPQIFKVIKKYANITDEEMLATFNMGAGLIAAVEEEGADAILQTLRGIGADAYRIGQTVPSDGGADVVFSRKLRWV
jgi:phosphoribosylformylglycinamidine cyclo-ligase